MKIGDLVRINNSDSTVAIKGSICVIRDLNPNVMWLQMLGMRGYTGRIEPGDVELIGNTGCNTEKEVVQYTERDIKRFNEWLLAGNSLLPNTVNKILVIKEWQNEVYGTN
jgi:hypothetical protein